MKGLSLGNFKKVSENNDSAVLRHPAGHHIVIAKRSLNPKLQQQLSKLPKVMADGGDVDDTDPGTNALQTGESSIGKGIFQTGKAIMKMVGMADGGDPADKLDIEQMPDDIAASGEESALPPADISAASAPAVGAAPPSGPQMYQMPALQQGAGNNPAMQSQGNMMQQMQGAFAQQASGISGMAKAQADLEAQKAQRLQQYSADLDKIQKQYQQVLFGHSDQSLKAVQDAQNGHISGDAYTNDDGSGGLVGGAMNALRDASQNTKVDPERYEKSKSIPGRVATAIGILLGGVGQGLLRTQQNPALQFLNQQIDRDVQAQQATINNKNNILNGYLKLTGNMRDSLAMTRSFYLDKMAADTQAMAASSGSDMVKQNAKVLLGQLDQQKLSTLAPMAMRTSGLMLANNGQVDPASVIPLLIPQNLQPKAYEEVKHAQDASESEKSILGAFDAATKQNSIVGRVSNLQFRDPGSITQFNALTLPLIKDATGRVNEREQAVLEALAPKPGQSNETIQRNRLALQQFINGKKSAPIMKSYGVNLQNYNSTKLQQGLQPNPSMTAQQPEQ